MPILVLPRTVALSDRLREAVGARLCPYTGPIERLLQTETHTVWGTSLCERERNRVRCRLEGGTSTFELRLDQGGLSVETDPLGTCPVWIAPARESGDWLVSTEAKALALFAPVRLRADAELFAPGARLPGWSPFANVQRLPQGKSLHLVGKCIRSEGSTPGFELGPQQTDASEENEWAHALGSVLLDSFRTHEVPTGCFVSGGIDSSIACALACGQASAEPVRTYSLGTDAGNEFATARSLAEHLECNHREVELARSAVLEELDRVVFQNEVFDGLTAEILLQLSTLFGAAQAECERVTTGYGSDLLFDGMLRHTAYMRAVGLETTPELIGRTRWTGELAPFLAWSHGLAADHVFWQVEVMRTALQVPRQLCFVDGVEKHVLREAAVHSKLLPRELAFRSKIGMTEGTGANRVLSDALGLQDSFAYREKSATCSQRLRRILEEPLALSAEQ